MSVTADAPVRKNGCMANKKKPTGGKHATPRTNIGVPDDWHHVLRRIAAKRQQTLVYALIALLRQEAERLDVLDLPPAPWEIDEDE